jgi:hypothetical protein
VEVEEEEGGTGPAVEGFALTADPGLLVAEGNPADEAPVVAERGPTSFP